MALQHHRLADVHAAAQRERVLGVAVAVGLVVDEAAGEDREARATAGIDAIGALEAGVEAEPAALAATADADAAFAAAVAAGAGVEAEGRVAAIATGEDLDHAADGFRAVQAGARAAHDLDAIDQRDRQVLEGDQAGGGRAHAHAVDQHQHVVGLAAAHEHRGELAVAALVGDVDAGAAAQQVGERSRLGAQDLVAGDDFDRCQRGVCGDGGAGGGDDDLVQLVAGIGIGIGGEGGAGQQGGDGQAEREDSGQAGGTTGMTAGKDKLERRHAGTPSRAPAR